MLPKTEGVGLEPTRPFRVNALAGRRLKPLGHPSTLSSSALYFGPDPQLPRQGSNLDSSDPESDVLPIPPSGTVCRIRQLAEKADTVHILLSFNFRCFFFRIRQLTEDNVLTILSFFRNGSKNTKHSNVLTNEIVQLISGLKVFWI